MDADGDATTLELRDSPLHGQLVLDGDGGFRYTPNADYFGEDRKISVSRELTKLYEETIRGSVKEVLDHFSSKPPKGEFVIVVAGKGK